MATVIIRRLLQLVPVVLLATALVFVLVRLAPGDPVQQQLGARGARDPERVAALRQSWDWTSRSPSSTRSGCGTR